MNKSKILAIETSCDETSVSVICDGEILSNVIYSQLDLHKPYGGVVPSIARLAHQEKINSVLDAAIAESGLETTDLDAIAVTQGPGLAIALEVGINKARELAADLGIPLIGVNHMAGHIFSSQITSQGDKFKFDLGDSKFPTLGLLVSGGHTEFVEIQDSFTMRKIGQTVDDACGEAFDKFATMVGLEYPGGPKVSQIAEQFRDRLEVRVEREQQIYYVRGYARNSGEYKYQLPLPMSGTPDLNLSYSGLKTAVKQLVNHLSGVSAKLDIKQTGKVENLDAETLGELCVMFEAAALEILIIKLQRALEITKASQVWLGGGVASSRRLQQLLRDFGARNTVAVKIAPHPQFLTDNAAMIACAASVVWEQFKQSGVTSSNLGNVYVGEEIQALDRTPSWSL